MTTPADHYDFIVCGSGSSGSVVAGRLAANPDVHVLLLEAGPAGGPPSMGDPSAWHTLLGTELDWNFQGEPNPAAGGRRVGFSAGKVLGGSSAINVMAWVRGHRTDWDHYAQASGSDRWRHANVLDTYRRIEDWAGPPDPQYRGTGGPVYVAPTSDPHPLATAFLAAATSVEIPTFDHPNGRLLEEARGGALADVRIRDGRRVSLYDSYVAPVRGRPNLTVLTDAVVTAVLIDRGTATGVRFTRAGQSFDVRADGEVVLSLGAMNTPKVLMQSGIGDAAELTAFGIPVQRHLPGVGRSFQDHAAFGCLWEASTEVPPPRNNLSEAIVYATLSPESTSPDAFIWPPEVPLTTPENIARFGAPPANSWTLFGAVARPHSRGRLRLTGAHPTDALRIEDGFLSHPDDLRLAVECMRLAREIGNSPALRPLAAREIMPGPLDDAALADYVRNATSTFWHQCGTAKMGRDDLSVVDGDLRVHDVDDLRIADASILPRITTANTMAPAVIIGEYAADSLIARHRL